MPALTKAGSYWKTPRVRVSSQDTAPMRRPQRMTFASVMRVVTPCPGRVAVIAWSRTCAPTFGTSPRHALDRTDLTRGYRAEDGIAQAQSQDDAQECVESGWLTGLQTSQGAQTDPGIAC